MVYNEMGQTARYHSQVKQPPNTQYLTTKEHFHDDPVAREHPNGMKPTHKPSTFAKLYQNSQYDFMKRLEPKVRNSLTSTVNLSGLQKTEIKASATYRGNGNFVVEYPHSTLTYKTSQLVSSARLAGWRTEYQAKYTPKNASSYRGYSVLSDRHTARF